jgi:ADP-heptose:LPS heptosyltransferase
MNLLVIKTNALGDNVVFLPVVQALRRRLPNVRLSLITHSSVRELFEADVADDHLLVVSPVEMRTAWKRPWRLLPWHRWIARQKPEAILLSYDQSTVAHLLARLSSARIRLGARFGMTTRRGGLTHAVEWQPGWSIAQWHWEMARALVATIGGPTLPSAPPPPDLGHLLSGICRLPARIVIHPGSKSEMTRWPVDRYSQLALRLARSGYEVLWIRAPEADLPLPDGVAGAETTSVRELARLMASAALFIGNNSGPMHVANAVGTPLVVVSGRSPFVWDPAWHRETVRVLRKPELACQPCERHDWLPRICLATEEPLACLRRWDVNQVHAACVDFLDQLRINPL